MKFNISCPETGCNKLVELQSDEKLGEIIDKKIGDEINGTTISETFDGYTFKITGGFDKDGFAMKNGVLTQGKKRILLTKGCSMFRFKRNYHRRGIRKRRLVRGCIVSHDIKILNLKIIKKGANPIPGLTETGCEVPKRLGPKRATKILKQFGLIDIYNEKKKNKEERKNLRFMITKFAPKRKVTTKNNKEYTKSAKIQRLITPDRLRRKRIIKAIKKERKEAAIKGLEEYKKILKKFVDDKKRKKKDSKKNK